MPDSDAAKPTPACARRASDVTAATATLRRTQLKATAEWLRIGADKLEELSDAPDLKDVGTIRARDAASYIERMREDLEALRLLGFVPE